MTQARKHIVSIDHAGTYLCVSRCVRRSWLCGWDSYLQKSFEHRKPWVERKIAELAEIFACSVLSYAVMSNHFHLVVWMLPSEANAWTAHQVAERWCRLFPKKKPEEHQAKIEAIAANTASVAIYRQRLHDLSWLKPLGTSTPVRCALPAYTTNAGSKTDAQHRNCRYDPAGEQCRTATPQSQKTNSIHCLSRCVRRSWLCGLDEYLEKSFEHRKPWVEQRILELGGIFACGIYAYAVMSNHYHLVVHMSPNAANDWSAYEVARRWVKLYPTGKSDTDQLKVEAIVANETMIKIYRQRLTDLSWLMKSISEPIARRANAEDKVNGRFWQGVSANVLAPTAPVCANARGMDASGRVA